MAAGYSHNPGDLDALQNGRDRYQTSIYLPSPPTFKRKSTYYPEKDLSVLQDPNLDPFYLEQSLPDTVPLDSAERGEGPDQYFMLPTVSTGKTSSPGLAYSGSERLQHNSPSTPTALEIEGSLGFRKYATNSLEDARFCSKDSFSSERSESIPELSPSSSFSSYYSGSAHPNAAMKATEELYQHIKGSEAGKKFELRLCPPPRRYNAVASKPPPVQTTKPQSQLFGDSCENSTAYDRNHNSPYWWKPLPSPPSLANNNGSRLGKKGSSNSCRTQIDPSMISPPSLINPVTLEPHPTHFDQAFFIPANECPSPVPSPTTRPPLAEKDVNAVQRRPSVSSLDPYCERSAWESDSDSESIGRKSLSRKPIDTIRKVRSRAKLRVAKSATKLNAAKQDDSDLEHFPPIPNQFQEELPKCSMSSVRRPSSGDVFRPAERETMRLVAPSATSLVRRPSHGSSLRGECDIDRTTAAAMQAKSRRQRITPESHSLDQERSASFCRDEFSDDWIDNSKTLRRDPLFRRVWKSLRALSCRAGLPENRAVRPY
ncbi:hypothetical protein PHISP_07332 [Aspergillus sp. HF37]|nr:hypothetical protein PHISP_07332 [Aspergillus sp. HF37]